jgi:hypothetical protein
MRWVFSGVRGRAVAGFTAAMLCLVFIFISLAIAQTPMSRTVIMQPVPPDTPQPSSSFAQVDPNDPLAYVVRYDRWTEADERGFGEFIQGIADSNCNTVDACLKGRGNPFRASDPAWLNFRSDCADLPYYLRAYYAWKRGLPFSYEAAVEPRGYTRDIRYTARGNMVVERRNVLTDSVTGPVLLDTMRDVISSAMYRIHPDLDTPLPPDHYSVRLDPKAIRPGTVIYDPNGHLATIYRVEPDGRILFIDAHPDNSLTRETYDRRFVRSSPGMGAGFKNWRPLVLQGATRNAHGELIGGHIVAAANTQLTDFSDEQFFGNGAQKPADQDWSGGTFTLNGEVLDYYDYVRAKLAGGVLRFDPIQEVRNMVHSNCDDLHYRTLAVDIAIAAGIENKAQPGRLPYNIYGTEGEWETYSTPSRDARLKTAFKELRDEVERFVRLYKAHDSKITYAGHDLVGDLIATYDHESSACSVSYKRTDGSQITLSYNDALKRLFAMSFDPYHCVERRWGAADPKELATCQDGLEKQAWYGAEQGLRNQIERTYEARMDHDLATLKEPGGQGKGVGRPPDIDVRAFLLRIQKEGLPMASNKAVTPSGAGRAVTAQKTPPQQP